jgi:hypothetical protein
MAKLIEVHENLQQLQEPSRTTGHNIAIGKDTTTTCAERRRGDSAVGSPRKGDIYSHMPK